MVTGILILGAGLWIWRARTAGAGRTAAAGGGRAESKPALASTAGRAQSGVSGGNLLQNFIARLDASRPGLNRARMAGLYAQLKHLPAGEAARQLIAFLNSKKNAATGLDFQVGRGGKLETAPTLRVAALDWLAEFDLAAAADYARVIFAGSDSADEWALALRNYYWKSQKADDYFIARVQEAFSREAWLKEPSAGLAEAVDFPVAIGGAQAFEILNSVLRQSTALRMPVLVALDSWVIEDRSTAVPMIAGVTASASGLDAVSQATLLSRADIRDANQSAAVRSFLESETVSGSAKSEFLRQFPNQSMFVGYHLATELQAMSLKESAQLDVAALEWVSGLLSSGTCPALSQQLADTRERLERYVASAHKGGLL